MFILTILIGFAAALQAGSEKHDPAISKGEVVQCLEQTAKALDNVYLEYRVYSRIHDLSQGIPSGLGEDIRSAKDRTEWTVAWSAKGQARYWEVISRNPRYYHECYWSTGEAWNSLDLVGGNGTISNISPTLEIALPDEFFARLRGRKWSSIITENGDVAIANDPRYTDSPHVRVEFPVFEFPPQRYMLALSTKSGTPSRVYQIIDDNLYEDYELKGVAVLPSGKVVPQRYRIMAIAYDVATHVSVPKKIYEYEAELLRSEDQIEKIPCIEKLAFPRGTVVKNMFSDELSLVGNDLEDAFSAWLVSPIERTSRTDARTRLSAWYWEMDDLWNTPTTQLSMSELEHQCQQNCAPMALYALLRSVGKTRPPLNTLTGMCKTSADGTLLPDLVSASDQLGIPLVPVENAPEHMDGLRVPFIAVVNASGKSPGYHFQLAEPVNNDSSPAWRVWEFPWSVRVINDIRSLPKWTGIGLFPKTSDVQEWLGRQQRSRTTRNVWGILVGALVIIMAILVLKGRGNARQRGLVVPALVMLIGLVTGCSRSRPDREAASAGVAEPIYFDPKELNFGDLPVGAAEIKSVLLVNPSNLEFEVWAIWSGCTCTEILDGGHRVLPANGGATNVDVRFLAQRRGENGTTVIAKGVYAGMPKFVECRLDVRGIGRSEIRSDPPRLVLSRNSGVGKECRLIQFHGANEGEMQLSGITSRSGMISAELLDRKTAELEGGERRTIERYRVYPSASYAEWTGDSDEIMFAVRSPSEVVIHLPVIVDDKASRSER